jgi:siderophore synthetase component
VYDPQADGFAKFSLNVRITNCVRTSAWYELAGSVLLTSLLRPVFDGLRVAYPGTVLLGEPGYRTPELRALLSGVPLPAKANLKVRWACTPKDVLARDVPAAQLRVGDVVAFGLAGAYAWNISHHDFLMHPPPAFHYLNRLG